MYSTTNKRFYYDKFEKQKREFGAQEQRHLRYIIDSQGPDYLEKDPRWIKIMGQLKKQLDCNEASPVALKDRVGREMRAQHRHCKYIAESKFTTNLTELCNIEKNAQSMAVPDAASIFKQAIEEDREKFMRMTHLQTTNKVNQ